MDSDVVDVHALLACLESLEMASSMRKYNISKLVEEFRFMISFHEDPPEKFLENGKLVDLKSLFTEAKSIFFSFDVQKMNEDTAQEMNDKLVGLVSRIKPFKEEAREIYLQIDKSERSNFPTTEQVDFIDYIVQQLKQQIATDRDSCRARSASFAVLKHQIATVADLLPSLKAHCVMDIQEEDEDEEEELSPTEIEEMQKKNEEFRELRTRIMRVVYEIEYIADCSVSGLGRAWYHKFWLMDILEEIRIIMKAKVKIYDKGSVVEHLISGLMKREEISILNVPLAGKTALADEIYDNAHVIYYFDVRGRCVNSQSSENNKRKILIDIRSSLMKGGGEYKMEGEVSEMSDRELAEGLYRSLSGYRCLLIIEDVCDIQTLNELRRILQNSSSQSRILLTTRFAEVAFQLSFTYVVKLDAELLAKRFQMLLPQYFVASKCFKL